MVQFPARIHVLLASKKPLGVVIRRGPSAYVCTLLWNRHTDEFSLAQWLHGRIYERRSDLSPDGKYLIYFAMNGYWQSETRGSWTAISRAPWLKAVTLFGKGDCWQGGGLFTGDRTYWLNEGCGHQIIENSKEVQRDVKYQIKEYYGGECLSVYYPRLQRDNWVYQDFEKFERHNRSCTFEKNLPKGWILRKFAHAEMYHRQGKGCYWDEHELEHVPSQTILKYPDWEWAEWDETRLVWATAGCLYAGYLHGNELRNERLLYDFNNLHFEPIPAPY